MDILAQATHEEITFSGGNSLYYGLVQLGHAGVPPTGIGTGRRAAYRFKLVRDFFEEAAVAV